MARAKSHTQRFDVVARDTGKRGIVILREYIRSVRMRGFYQDTVVQREFRDGAGKPVEQGPPGTFRECATGSLLEIVDDDSSPRAKAILEVVPNREAESSTKTPSRPEHGPIPATRSKSVF